MKSKHLNELGKEIMMIEKGRPVHYLVSRHPEGVVMITTNFTAAYEYWKTLPTTIETELEVQGYGTVCDTSPVKERSKTLRTYDDSERFLEKNPGLFVRKV